MLSIIMKLRLYKNNSYSNIICTVSLAAFLLLWGIINSRLSGLESRMRCLELKVTAIAVKLGVDESLKLSEKALVGSQAVENQLEVPIIGAF